MPSVTTELARQVTSAATGMASETTLTQPSRPSVARESLCLRQPLTVPPSACSSSSASPTSQDASPALDPEATGPYLTAQSTPRGSSEGLVCLVEKELEDLDNAVVPLRLPEPITVPPAPMAPSLPSSSTLSRRASATSLTPALRSPNTPSVGGAMGGAMKSITRRSSNSFRRVQSFVARRQSSSHPRSRDGSIGPGIVRRENNPFLTDSDDECAIEKDECNSIFSADGTMQEFSPAGTSVASAAPSSRSGISPDAYPLAMLHGTPMTKFGKKKSIKRITLVFDPIAVKIYWEKGRSSTKDIYIDDIREIRTADDIGQYRLDFGLEESMGSRFFTIMYMRQGQTTTKPLHVVTDDDATFKAWTETLKSTCERRQAFATSLMSFDDKAIRRWWLNETDKIRALGDGRELDSLSIDHVCRSLHIHIPAQTLRENMEAATGKTGCLERMDLAEFQRFAQLMKSRKDISAIYRQFAGNPSLGITKEEFLRFLKDQQREDLGDSPWESIFANFARKGKPKDAADKHVNDSKECLTMSEVSFVSFLMSPYNSVIHKEPESYALDRPMSEYYISSSHNTYLLGRQVAGNSSVEGYISALKRGCRCIEIDCWDGNDDQPVVMHGRTWTPSISFAEVIKTIKRYAFSRSKFPLWISLEVRCSFATQANMAKIMIDTFGDLLVRESLENRKDCLPSPSELMGRILIKVKQSQPPEEPARSGERLTRRRGNSQPSPYSRPMLQDMVPVPASPLLSPTALSRPNRPHNIINTITEGRVHDASSNPSECESESEKDSASRKTSSKINPVLGKLGVYCVGIQFEGFETPEAKKFNHIFSFKEQTFAKKSQPGEQKRALYFHNMRYMMRVYPNGTRIGSSNFNPLLYWKRGVQMAALNWQTFDLGMQLNQAMFDSGTDQSGYVLKPIEGREFKRMPTLKPEEWTTKAPRKSVSFTIKVISAQQLMRPINFGERRSMDPYVEVEVILANDTRNKTDVVANNLGQEKLLKQRTKIVRENGYNPIFDESYEFDITTKYPELIFVRWSVKLADKSYNDRSAPIAIGIAKLSSLKQGYRAIPLYTPYGDKCLFSTLFCEIKKGEIKDIMVNLSQDVSRNGGKLKNISRTVKSFPSVPSPKSSIESSRS